MLKRVKKAASLVGGQGRSSASEASQAGPLRDVPQGADAEAVARAAALVDALMERAEEGVAAVPDFQAMLALGTEIFAQPCELEYHLALTERMSKTGAVARMAWLVQNNTCSDEVRPGAQMGLRLLTYCAAVCDNKNPVSEAVNRTLTEQSAIEVAARILALDKVTEATKVSLYQLLCHMALLSHQHHPRALELLPAVSAHFKEQHEAQAQSDQTDQADQADQAAGPVQDAILDLLLALSLNPENRAALLKSDGFLAGLKLAFPVCFRTTQILCNVVGAEEEEEGIIAIPARDIVREAVQALNAYGGLYRGQKVDWRTLRAVHNLAKAEAHKELLVEAGAVAILGQIVIRDSEGDRAREEAATALAQLMFIRAGADALAKERKTVERLRGLANSTSSGSCNQCSSHVCAITGSALAAMKRFAGNKGRYEFGGGFRRVAGIKQRFLRSTKTGDRDRDRDREYSQDELIATAAEALVADEMGQQSRHGLVPGGGAGSGTVMLSYSWQQQDRIRAIAASLQSAGFKVWLDVEQMTGSTLETMAEAVEDASVVLMCCSEAYKESVNCRLEAEYAFQQRKALVPLLLEDGYQPTGWLGALCGSRLYFDFSKDSLHGQSLGSLVNELRRKLPDSTPGGGEAPVAATDDGVSSAPGDAGAGTTAVVVELDGGAGQAGESVVDGFESWDTAQVVAWAAALGEQRIDTEPLVRFLEEESYDGRLLATLRDALVSARDFECLGTLGLTSFTDRLRFWQALKALT